MRQEWKNLSKGIKRAIIVLAVILFIIGHARDTGGKWYLWNNEHYITDSTRFKFNKLSKVEKIENGLALSIGMYGLFFSGLWIKAGFRKYK